MFWYARATFRYREKPSKKKHRPDLEKCPNWKFGNRFCLGVRGGLVRGTYYEGEKRCVKMGKIKTLSLTLNMQD